MVATEVAQKIQLVAGEFTPSEASDVINALIREKINFHRIQRWSECERCDTTDTGYLDGRIGELTRDKDAAAELIKEARREGKRISIQGKLEVTIIED